LLCDWAKLAACKIHLKIKIPHNYEQETIIVLKLGIIWFYCAPQHRAISMYIVSPTYLYVIVCIKDNIYKSAPLFPHTYVYLAYVGYLSCTVC
jgi:hypothetical protein